MEYTVYKSRRSSIDSSPLYSIACLAKLNSKINHPNRHYAISIQLSWNRITVHRQHNETQGYIHIYALFVLGQKGSINGLLKYLHTYPTFTDYTRGNKWLSTITNNIYIFFVTLYCVYFLNEIFILIWIFKYQAKIAPWIWILRSPVGKKYGKYKIKIFVIFSFIFSLSTVAVALKFQMVAFIDALYICKTVADFKIRRIQIFCIF